MRPFETYSEAAKRSLEWSASHPKDLRLTRERELTVRIYPERPSKPRPGTPIPNAIKKLDLQFVDIPSSKKGTQGTEKTPNTVAGKTARGKAGKWDLSFEFQKDGNFVATDSSANGKIVAKGDWSQTGTAVSIQTENYLYMGTVSGDTIEGKRVTRGQGSRTVESWKVSSNLERLPKTDASAPDPLTGTKWTQGRWYAFWFERNGILLYDHAVGTKSSQIHRDGTWERNGNEIRWETPNTPGYKYVGLLQGNRIAVTNYFKNGNAPERASDDFVRQP